jgi:hypothetical protein
MTIDQFADAVHVEASVFVAATKERFPDLAERDLPLHGWVNNFYDYLGTLETEGLEGPEAVKKTATMFPEYSLLVAITTAYRMKDLALLSMAMQTATLFVDKQR